jgi:hypothetical protein
MASSVHWILFPEFIWTRRPECPSENAILANEKAVVGIRVFHVSRLAAASSISDLCAGSIIHDPRVLALCTLLLSA